MMKQYLRKALSALLFCALLLSGMTPALGEALEIGAPDEAPEAVEIEETVVVEADDGEAVAGEIAMADSDADSGAVEAAPEETEVALADALEDGARLEAAEAAGRVPRESPEDGISIDESFEDRSFRFYIKRHIDANDDGFLSEGEISGVTCIDFNKWKDAGENYSVHGLSGIAVFSNLEILKCREQYYLENLDPDLVGLSNLKVLDCGRTGLGWLHVNACPQLKVLICDNCYLYALDVSPCPQLEVLNCACNDISSLDLSGNPQLRELDCSSNAMATLNLTGCSGLYALHCDGSAFKSLDISDFPLLKDLPFSANYDFGNRDSNFRLYGQEIIPPEEREDWYGSGSGSQSLSIDTGFTVTSGSRSLTTKRMNASFKKTVYLKDAMLLAGYDAFKIRHAGISDTRIASLTCRDGTLRVVPKKAGKAVVTVDLLQRNFKKTYKLTLTVKDPTLPTKVALDRTKATMYLGNGKLTLNATMTPAKAGATPKSGLTWKSSNTKVAKVNSSGVVTALKAGTAKITVTTARGGKTATCAITVRDPNLPKGVALDRTSVKLFAGEVKNFRLTPTLSWWVEELATNRKDAITWSSSDKTVAKVSASGLVTPLKPGKATITARTANGKKATCAVTISKNKVDSLHAKPTASQIRRLAKYEPCGFLKSVEVVNQSKIVLEWYLMNGRNKALAKTPTMEMFVRFPKEVIVPNDGEEGDEGSEDYEDPYVYIALTDYDYRTVNVPANSYKLIRVTLTPGKCYDFKADIKLSTVKPILEGELYWVGE